MLQLNPARTEVRLLVVEDDAEFLAWIEHLLRNEIEGDLRLEPASTLAAAIDALERGAFDLVLLDLGLPDSEGLDGLDALLRVRPEQPVVVLTGADEQRYALEALDRGAQDFLGKDDVDAITLDRSVRHSLVRAQSEQRRRAAEDRLQMFASHSRDVIATVDVTGVILFVSESTRRLLGVEPLMFVGRRLADVVTSEDVAAARALWGTVRRTGVSQATRLRLPRADGGSEWFEVAITPPHRAGRLHADRPYAMVLRDLGDQVGLEEQLSRVRRHAALGQLAGGIAHEFNNLLTVVAGASAHLRAELPSGACTDALRLIGDSIERGSTLTAQLLTIGREAKPDLAPEHPAAVVDELREILRTAFSGSTVLRIDVAPDTPEVAVGDGELDQILLNLALNARDAVAGRGTVEILVRPVIGTHSSGRMEGDHVEIVVRDDGVGMDEATLRRAAEPMFSTKPPGHGAGLGLATVDALATAAGGSLQLESSPGLGTTARVMLPIHGAKPSARRPRVAQGIDDPVVLVVDDRPQLLSVTRRLLELQSHRTRGADGAEAARRVMAERQHVVALVCDVNLGATSGPELVAELRADRPDLPVVYVSGDVELPGDADDTTGRTAFLRKPFTAEALDAALQLVMMQSC